MSALERPTEPEPGIDRLLREALRDDLPADVEARLEARLRAFLWSRRSREEGRLLGSPLAAATRWAAARLALALAASLLLATGLALQVAAAPGASDEPLRRINLSVSVFRALQGVAAWRCTGLSDAALDSPRALAESVYRRWVPVGAAKGTKGTVVATYRSADPPADYELVLDAETLLPREVRRSDGRLIPGEATCVWSGGIPRATGEPR